MKTTEDQLCIRCKKRLIYIKKRALCRRCYQKEHAQGNIPSPSGGLKETRGTKIRENEGEVQFIKNFFQHNNWTFNPAVFRLNGEKYNPDFYDGERNVFIEVSRTRQAYYQNKPKYDLMRQLYPKINFEIRRPDGELLDETQPINSQL